jgi:hypothetical protein
MPTVWPPEKRTMRSTVFISTSSITCCYYFSSLDAPHHHLVGVLPTHGKKKKKTPELRRLYVEFRHIWPSLPCRAAFLNHPDPTSKAITIKKKGKNYMGHHSFSGPYRATNHGLSIRRMSKPESRAAHARTRLSSRRYMYPLARSLGLSLSRHPTRASHSPW